MPEQTYRLITRGDLDGIACAVLLRHLGFVDDDIVFVHPKDMQDGKVELTDHDIIANLPYVEGAQMCFDHHASEAVRITDKTGTRVFDPEAPSAAQVIYDYYGADHFSGISTEMMKEVNRADAAEFTREDILDPDDWMLLHFITDPRTGLGRVKNFRISNIELMRRLIGFCAEYDIADILMIPDVRDRVMVYNQYAADFQAQLKKCAKLYGSLAVVDLTEEETIYPGNRFMVYAMLPECAVSIHVIWSKDKDKIVFATGKSIFNDESDVHIGKLMLKHGGGGHAGAGTCQVGPEQAEAVMKDLIKEITGQES